MDIDYCQNVNTFFSLLRSGLYGKPVPGAELPSVIDWEAVAVLARKHAVLGVIIESVRFLPDGLKPPAEMQARMNGFALKLIQSNLRIDRGVARLVSFFEEHGIKGVLLKGQGIARSYRLPQMRQPGDIDFYVGEAQYLRAMELCREFLMDGGAFSEESNQHFNFRMDGRVVEVHRIATEIYSPYRRSRFNGWIHNQVDSAPDRRTLSIANVDVTVPAVNFNVIYIFYHAMRHFVVGGVGLRQLCDWAMVFNAHADQIDTEQLKVNIKRFGLLRGWKLFACIAVQWLGVDPQKMPYYDARWARRAAPLLESIVSGGNFGFHSKITATAPTTETGLEFAVLKYRYIVRYLVHTFPILPVESTCYYLFRQYCVLQTGCRMLAERFKRRG